MKRDKAKTEHRGISSAKSSPFAPKALNEASPSPSHLNLENQLEQRAFRPAGEVAKEQSRQLPEPVNYSAMTQEQLRVLIENYVPADGSKLTMAELLHNSEVKLKKYKESVYFGMMINGKRHGQGIMLYNNGKVYEGEWEADLKHGHGYERFPNGSCYTGEYLNGKPEGFGKYLWQNGEIYEGEWANGLKHGSGFWKGARGDSYVGEWKFGKADGCGVHTWLNGDRYEGDFKQCLKHGQGTEKFANGDVYVGAYVNGKPEGYGEYHWKEGSFYKGGFLRGLRHGQGVWKKGPGVSDKYQGEYRNDKKEGKGIFTWASGNVYKGQYFNDLRHGEGEMIWKDGTVYIGSWERGIQHGYGEIQMPGMPPQRGEFECNVLITSERPQPGQKQQPREHQARFQTPTSNYRLSSRLPPRPGQQQSWQLSHNSHHDKSLRRNVLKISRERLEGRRIEGKARSSQPGKFRR